MERFSITDPNGLRQVVDLVCEDARHHTEERALVLALSGELGAGKTTFTQALARALGVTEIVTSPTFVVMKRYPLSDQRFGSLVHVDLYRIDDIDELVPLRFKEAIDDPRNIVVIEWPERAPSAVPLHATPITFAVLEDGSRVITYGR